MTTFPLHRGTNISHWLSQSSARGAERRLKFTREDTARLADLGLDHLRLPVDEEQLWDDAGNRQTEAWDLLNQGLDWCAEQGMRAVVDLHILRCHYFNAGPEGKTLFTDPKAAAHFGDVWDELSCALRDRPVDRVAYELLNEAVADDSADWNRVLRAPYEAIRAAEPNRFIAIGSNRWCQTATFPELQVPADDPRIILVFHYYNPMPITHYRASWVPGLRDYDGPIQYPGKPIPDEALAAATPALRAQLEPLNNEFGPETMQDDLLPALAKATAMKLPLWCNEFGVIANTPNDIRGRWYRDFVSVLESRAIAWANWDFRGGFGLYDKNNNPTTVLKTLFPAQ